MTSKITRTVGGHYEINATGAILCSGHRVAAGAEGNRDTGTILEITGATALVRWDSRIITRLPLVNQDVRVIV